MPCIFCEIVHGNAPGSIVYADKVVVVLMDINPVNIGHVMVIPKTHSSSLAEMDESTGMHVFKIAHRTAAAVRVAGLRCEGVNLFLADGEAAFQDVFHVHLHVIPRYQGDSFVIRADWNFKPPRGELEATAASIRAAYMQLWEVG